MVSTLGLIALVLVILLVGFTIGEYIHEKRGLVPASIVVIALLLIGGVIGSPLFVEKPMKNSVVLVTQNN